MKPLYFARSVWHTRPSQLTARLALVARRRALDRAAWLAPKLDAPYPELRAELPEPLFARRGERASAVPGAADHALEVELPAERRRIAVPVDWHPIGWGRYEQLRHMHLHYMEHLEAADDAAFAAHVLDWIDSNPRRAPGAWKIAWNSFVVAVRARVWMHELARRRTALAPEVVEAMRRSLVEQLRFLERNLELDLGGNHLIKDLAALAWGARSFAGEDSERWSRVVERRLPRELDEQVLADGMHYERSAAYHAQVFADLLDVASVLPEGALRARVRESLDAMAQVLADLTHPDGLVSQFNDGGLHLSYSTRECLAVHARLGGRSPRPRGVFALEAAGYFGLRGAGSLVVFDCGPIGPDHLPAHGHGDLLAFEWSVDGRRVIVDAGVLEYAPGRWRDLSRSTGAHNTVTLDDADQCEFWHAFRVGRRARCRLRQVRIGDGELIVCGAHDGYSRLAGRPEHERTLRATDGGLRVFDRLRRGAGQRARARLLLHPDVRVSRRGATLRLEVGSAEIELVAPHPTEIADAWWFPDFGVRVPTRQIVLDYGAAPCAGTFELRRAPARAAQDAEPQCEPRGLASPRTEVERA